MPKNALVCMSCVLEGAPSWGPPFYLWSPSDTHALHAPLTAGPALLFWTSHRPILACFISLALCFGNGEPNLRFRPGSVCILLRGRHAGTKAVVAQINVSKGPGFDSW